MAAMELLSSLMDPREKDKLKEFNQHTTLPLEYSKLKKKILNRKQYKKPKKFLSRNELKKAGLYNLPREELKYKDYAALNELWTSYMNEMLGNKVTDLIDISDPRYSNLSSQINKADFHGAKLKVVRSKCPNLVGISGIVVLDTKNTFKVVGKDDILRTVPKMDSVFEIRWKKFAFTIFGKHIAIRPGERNTKKIKQLKEMDL